MNMLKIYIDTAMLEQLCEQPKKRQKNKGLKKPEIRIERHCLVNRIGFLQLLVASYY